MLVSSRCRLVLSLLMPHGGSPALHRPAFIRAVRRRAPVCTAAGATIPKEERSFIVRNDRNDVEVLQCANPQMVEQGLLELGGLPHVCVAGESNSGKSSLINHLLKKKLAKVGAEKCLEGVGWGEIPYRYLSIFYIGYWIYILIF